MIALTCLLILFRFEKSAEIILSRSDEGVLVTSGQVDDVCKTEHRDNSYKNCDTFLKDEEISDEDNFEEFVPFVMCGCGCGTVLSFQYIGINV